MKVRQMQSRIKTLLGFSAALLLMSSSMMMEIRLKLSFFIFGQTNSDDKDVANAQFWKFVAKILIHHLAGHAICKLG